MSAIGFFLVALIGAVLVGTVRAIAQPAPRFRPSLRPQPARAIRIETPAEPALPEAVWVEGRA